MFILAEIINDNFYNKILTFLIISVLTNIQYTFNILKWLNVIKSYFFVEKRGTSINPAGLFHGKWKDKYKCLKCLMVRIFQEIIIQFQNSYFFYK